LIGVPHKFLENYGTLDEHNINLGFTAENIKEDIKEFLS
jgi:cob(I)alamin adenosyltransferase